MPSIKLTSAQVGWIKWLALISMVIDHAARILLATDSPAFLPCTTIGRLAYPLFAFLLAHNLMHFSKSPRNYAIRLAVFALISQPVYMYTFPESAPLNIFATLLFGLGLLIAFQRWQQAHTFKTALPLGVLTLLGGLTGFAFEYGTIGIVLPTVWWLWLQKPAGTYTLLLAIFLLALNHLTPQALAGVMALPLVVACTKKPFPAPPSMPRLFFYSFYPLHLLLLLLFKA